MQILKCCSHDDHVQYAYTMQAIIYTYTKIIQFINTNLNFFCFVFILANVKILKTRNTLK